MRTVDTQNQWGVRHTAMRSGSVLKGILLGALTLGNTSCLTQLAANSTVRIMGRASPAMQEQADPGVAEAALPYAIAQSEGLLLVVPNNRQLRVTLMRTYSSYAFGFLEDRMEQADVDDDEVRIEHYRERATANYLRAKALGFDQMNRDEDGDGGPEGAYHRGLDEWRAYLQRFDDADQTPLVFWTGYAWVRWINLHKDDMNALADLPFAIACFERAVQLDPSYNVHAPELAMAAYYASRPAALGGEPVRALAGFNAVIAATQGRFLTYKVLMARMYAVSVQDRGMFERLLNEVLEAGDVMPEQRLANLLAKRRARRYLAQIDTLFGPPNEPGDSAPDTTTDSSTPEGSAGTPSAPTAPAP